MKLPENEQAVIPKAKITDYLLSDTHPVGKDKAAFFTRFGFSVESWEELSEALIQHAQTHDVTEIVQSPHGTKHIVEGSIESPDGRNPDIRVVWLVEKDDTVPRLITTYPLD